MRLPRLAMMASLCFSCCVLTLHSGAQGQPPATPPAAAAMVPGLDPAVELIDLIDTNSLHVGGKDGTKPIGGKSLEEVVNGSKQPVVVIMADELRLGPNQFALGDGTRPLKNVVVLAKSILVEDKVTFSLEHPSPLKPFLFGQNKSIRDAISLSLNADAKTPQPQYHGRDLTIVANEVRFKGAGRIELRQRDYLRVVRDQFEEFATADVFKAEFSAVLKELKVEDIRKAEPGEGGHFKLAVKRIIYPNWANNWDDDKRAAMKDHIVVTQTGHTKNGETVAVKFPDKLGDWLPSGVLQRWLTRRLELLNGRFVQAETNSDWESLRAVLADIKELPPISYIEEEPRKRAASVLTAIREREKAYSGVRQREVTIDVDGAAKSVKVFTDGLSGKAYMLPNELLMTRKSQNGQDYLGIVRLLPDGQRVQFSFSAKLTADPRLKLQLSRKLAEQNYALEGFFTNFKLGVDIERLSEIQELKISNADDYVNFTMVVDRKSANLVLGQLALYPGLLLPLKYETAGESKVAGNLSVGLSLARRADVPVVIEKDRVRNTGNRAFYITYLRGGTDKFVRLEPSLTVDAQQTTRLQLPAEIDLAGITVPPEAVHFLSRDALSLEDFYPIDKEDILDEIKVVNKLTSNADRGGRLRRVKIEVTYAVGEGKDKSEASAGKYELGEYLTTGWTKNIWMLKPRNGKVSLTVKGTAEYENGSFTFEGGQDGNEIVITDKMLPRPSK